MRSKHEQPFVAHFVPGLERGVALLPMDKDAKLGLSAGDGGAKTALSPRSKTLHRAVSGRHEAFLTESGFVHFSDDHGGHARARSGGFFQSF